MKAFKTYLLKRKLDTISYFAKHPEELKGKKAFSNRIYTEVEVTGDFQTQINMKIIKRGVEDKTKVIHDKMNRLSKAMEKVEKIDSLLRDLQKKKQQLLEQKEHTPQKCRCALDFNIQGKLFEAETERANEEEAKQDRRVFSAAYCPKIKDNLNSDDDQVQRESQKLEKNLVKLRQKLLLWDEKVQQSAPNI